MFTYRTADPVNRYWIPTIWQWLREVQDRGAVCQSPNQRRGSNAQIHVASSHTSGTANFFNRSLQMRFILSLL